MQPLDQLGGRNKLDIFFDKIEAGLELSEQVEQVSAQAMQRRGQSAGKLAEGRSQLIGHLSVDYSEHRFGLGQVEPAGKKRAERELARLCQSRAGSANL